MSPTNWRITVAYVYVRESERWVSSSRSGSPESTVCQRLTQLGEGTPGTRAVPGPNTAPIGRLLEISVLQLCHRGCSPPTRHKLADSISAPSSVLGCQLYLLHGQARSRSGERCGFVYPVNLKQNGHKQPHVAPQAAVTARTSHGQTVRLTHQKHQHEHCRLSHSTPVAVPRGHDAVATSGYAGAIGFPRIPHPGARHYGKCSCHGSLVTEALHLLPPAKIQSAQQPFRAIWTWVSIMKNLLSWLFFFIREKVIGSHKRVISNVIDLCLNGS